VENLSLVRGNALLANTNSEQTSNVRPGGFSDSASKENDSKRVLIVDDHDLFRELVALVLETHAGFGENVQARSLVEACQVLATSSGEPDLVIVDLDLPGGDGIELIGKLREAWSRVPVLALTVGRNPERRNRALRAGADEVLPTAASGAELLGVVRRLGGG
jgi:DNA-binding NarL/FixJ family response regulator